MSKTQSRLGVTIPEPCDCIMNLITIPDGLLISTNCPTSVTNTINWQIRANIENGNDWDEGDWGDFLDAEGSLFYDNGIVDQLVRIQYEENGCTKYSNIVDTYVKCNCACWANVIYDPILSSDLVLFKEGCLFATTKWQYYDTIEEEWTDVQTGGTTYEWTEEGLYRVKVTNTVCCDTYSNIAITYAI